MGLFSRKKDKTETPFNRIKNECKTRNIPLAYFYGWHNHIGNPTLNDELINEFFNRPHLLYKTELRVTLLLPEFDTKIRGAALGGDGFVSSSKEQKKVKCPFYFADKGIMFKEAINQTSDLRLPWSDITGCEQFKKESIIKADSVKYTVRFESVDTAGLFTFFVKDHMEGKVDDGWE